MVLDITREDLVLQVAKQKAQRGPQRKRCLGSSSRRVLTAS